MTFAAAGLLFALAALGVPWWLHRRDQHGERRREVSSILLMRPAAEPLQPHRRVRHRLLLALRMVLLAALILAFAGPLLERDDPAAGMDRVRPQLLVLDVSLSMQARFDDARRQARALLATLPAGAPAALVLAGAELLPATALAFDRAALSAALGSAEPGWTRLEFAGLLARLGVLASSLGQGPFDVHLISDFQQSAMPEQFNALLPGSGGGIAALTLHPVDGPAANWQVTAIRQQQELVVTVTAHGGAAQSRSVRLSAGNATLATRRVNVPADGRAELRLPLPGPADADQGLSIEIDGSDVLAADDRTYLAVRAAEAVPLPVLAAPGSAQRRYFEAAVAADAAGFRVTGAETDAPVLAVLDAGHLSAAQARRLRRHLDRGGRALLTAGPELSRAGRLAVPELGLENVRSPAGLALRQTEPGHPLTERNSAWSDVTVQRALAPAPGIAGETVLALEDGTPLLVEYPVGAGRVLLLTTALEREWSSLVASAGFVALVHDVLGYLAEDTLPVEALAGEPVAVPTGNVQVFDSAGRRRLALGETVGRAGVRIAEPGIYSLRTPSRQALLAVRPDPRESALTAAPGPWLTRWERAVRAPEATSSNDSDMARAAGLGLSPWLLGLAAALFLLEATFANLARPGARP